MESKIILGLLMGIFAGGTTKALIMVSSNPALAPAARNQFFFSANTAPIIVFAWIVYTFGAYSAKFGFMAIGEVIVGAVLAGLFSHQVRLGMTATALPVLLVGWAVL